jgi:hypothetical protein
MTHSTSAVSRLPVTRKLLGNLENCYQDFPQVALPDELKDANPLGIWRMVDGEFTREGVA